MIKVGIIGSGFGLYGLLPAFNTTKGCKVTCICGKNTDRLLNYCKSIGLTNIYTDWQEMLKKEELDALVIAVVPSAQYKIAKVAIKKGLHIFAEKPLAASYKQANELCILAEKAGIINAVDFEFPEINIWKKVKEYIDDKTYGPLRYINLNWDFQSYDIKNKIKSWKTDSLEGGGALAFYFSHSLYYLEYFAGKIKDFKSQLVFSKDSLNGGEVGVDLVLKFKDVNGYAHLSCNTPGINKHSLTFIFEKGTIVLENKNGSYTNFGITSYSDTGRKKVSLKETNSKNEDERVRIVKKLSSRFINSIITHRQFYPSFYEGLRVMELVEKIRKDSHER